jgi:hypothetical protein
MNKFLLTLLLFCTSGISKAQIPPYHATIFDSSATTGYYFLVPTRITSPNLGFHSQLVLDKYGDVVYYKSLGTLNNTPDFKVQPNGMISYFANMKFYMLDSTFTIIDSVFCQNGITTDSHDFQILPNGHFLLLGYENVTMDLSAYAWFKPTGSHGGSVASVKCNVIQELDTNKNVVFEWHTKDHFSFADADSAWFSNPNVVDWTHSNAVEMDDDGNILLSCRHFDEITKINRSDSSIIWRLGGVQNQFTFLNDTTPFYGQHDIRRIPNGNITLLDNAYRVLAFPYHGVRAQEYQLDEVNKTATLAWSYMYDSSMYSRSTGDVQRLPNGNTLVDFGNINTNNVTFTVVDPLKNKVFELAFNDTMSSYRAFNFQQLPWMFHRPQVTCFDSAGITYLDAGAGYASYAWNNGGISRMIPVTSPDTYYVFVPYGNGGFISSEKMIVTNVQDPCNYIASVFSQDHNQSLEAYPNPAGEKLFVTCDLLQDENAELAMFDMLGNRITFVQEPAGKSKTQTTLDIRNLPAGVYFLQLKTTQKSVTVKVVRS